MADQPTLQTPRLTLRPFAMDDAPAVQRLAGDREVASTTQHIPHPYEDGLAERWIGTHQARFDRGEQVTFAIVRKEGGDLIGAIGIVIEAEHEHAELGYWIGRPYWGNGYCTEAARAVVAYGFRVLRLRRVFARHMARNPASGRVMQKVGMACEGRMRGHIRKWGQFEDLIVYGVLAGEIDTVGDDSYRNGADREPRDGNRAQLR